MCNLVIEVSHHRVIRVLVSSDQAQVYLINNDEVSLSQVVTFLHPERVREVGKLVKKLQQIDQRRN